MCTNGPLTTHNPQPFYSEEKNQSQLDVLIALPDIHKNLLKEKKKRKRETIVCVFVCVSDSVSLATVISFLSTAVDLNSVCFYRFSCITKQGRTQ